MKENWARKGLAPVMVDVRHRTIDFESDISQAETVWAAGHYPHWGKPIDGWSGQETVIKRYIIKKPNEGMPMNPSIEYPIIRIEK